jgi:antitoxin component of RelBE/YafQ-DinJ toxin-antitoxin module
MANTPIRHIRIPDEVWDAARTATESNGTTIAAVINAALRKYITRHTPKQ